jgi:hypothetical protein
MGFSMNLPASSSYWGLGHPPWLWKPHDNDHDYKKTWHNTTVLAWTGNRSPFFFLFVDVYCFPSKTYIHQQTSTTRKIPCLLRWFGFVLAIIFLDSHASSYSLGLVDWKLPHQGLAGQTRKVRKTFVGTNPGFGLSSGMFEMSFSRIP